MPLQASIVLSPDRSQYWDVDGGRWLPALLSPDGKLCWTGSDWVPIAHGAESETNPSAVSPYVTATAMCGALAAAIMFLGHGFSEEARKLTEVVATLPILLIHSVADSIRERKLVFSTQSLLAPLRSMARPLRADATVGAAAAAGAASEVAPGTPATATTLITGAASVTSGAEVEPAPAIPDPGARPIPWWFSGALLGGILALFDNVAGVVLATMGPSGALVNVVLALGAAVGLGMFVARRFERRVPGLLAVMAYVGAFFNSVFYAIVLRGDLTVIPSGVIFGGTALLLLALGGYFVERRLVRRRAAAARGGTTPSRPDAAGPAVRPVVLAEAGHVYWDGAAWKPVVQLSEDRRHVWNGEAWLPVSTEPASRRGEVAASGSNPG